MDIERLVNAVANGDADAAEAGVVIAQQGPEMVPFLAEAFARTKSWRGRTALLFYAIPFARVSEPAFELGLRALSDRSYMVRYRACMILAYALRKNALPSLEQLRNHSDARTRDDADRAIDAITHQNHHYFVDRDHSGRTLWILNEGDSQGT